MFVEAYLQTAEKLIQSYELQQPLHLYLKAFFKENKKYGSRDRRFISELVYAYYRVGNQELTHSTRDVMLLSAYIKSSFPKLFFEKTRPELVETFEMEVNEKLLYVEEKFELKVTIPFELSEDLNSSDYLLQLFSEPRVFIRIRKNKKEIIQQLQASAIPFIEENPVCLSFQSNVKLDEVLAPEDYVIQDMASQAVGEYFKPKARETWWDCCTASGGKSIMLLDIQPNLNLIVSDVRESILKNLHLRFQRYNYQSKYVSYCLDLTLPVTSLSNHSVDYIICDVPCSGSGTWSRSPEQFYYFTKENLVEFHNRQLSIAKEAFSKLKPNGIMYYITCSVFKEENESVLSHFNNDESEIVSSKVLRFPHRGADCLFIGLIRKK